MMQTPRKHPQEPYPDPFGAGAPAGASGPVTCLGKTFPDDAARREHFLGLLREKLQDPEFRRIEGFPLGEDEDILALSDPPYYTACPNPWLGDFIAAWEEQKSPPTPGEPADGTGGHRREPFVADVSEGKNDPIYNAHAYHTKVPHRAIMRYILHYTAPGDVVFDGFCGTGMTGVAAQMCGDKAAVESLGYRVDHDGGILPQERAEGGRWGDGGGKGKRGEGGRGGGRDEEGGKPFSKLGARRAVLNDLSPAATFIAYNYNTPVDVTAFEREARRILREVEAECGWMYETLHPDGKTKGKINHTVWSDVFVCPECTNEVIFWEVAVNKIDGTVKNHFPCPHCGAHLTKRGMDRAWVTKFDRGLNESIRQIKQVPVLINYTIDGKKFDKSPDGNDLLLIDKIESSDIPYWFPTNRMMEGKETRRNDPFGLTHVHHFYSKRNLWIISALRSHCTAGPLLLWFNSQLINISRLNRYRPGVSFPYNPLSGTMYMGSQVSEPCVFTAYKNKLDKLVEAFKHIDSHCIISTQSITQATTMPPESVDYIFIDPPFGANMTYSELSFLWEQWFRVWTDNATEAIENSVQQKGIDEYRFLMRSCFREAYRVLKPGRWMTVEFSNTKASVWNSIQEALAESGFIVAHVSALDKQQGSFKAVTTPTAVKQDLVISSYKPDGDFENKFQDESMSEEGVWDFVRAHLEYLPVVKDDGGSSLVAVVERDPRILYDQMLAYFVRKGYPVPINSAEFQEGLARRFSYRDGMYFLPDQGAEYDKKRLSSGEMRQISLSVSDEASAIAWLRQILNNKPQKLQDVHPVFIKELIGWRKYEKPLELSELLEQNFLRYDGIGDVPSQIHDYLSANFEELRHLSKDSPELMSRAKDRWYVPDPHRAGDLERLRERSLLKEFAEYKGPSQKHLKVFRLEALRAGFRRAWQEQDYATIIAVARRIPENVLQEDSKLLMWYDQAITRSGEE